MRHLKAFHIFHVAASSSSYSEAASKLNITHGAVSKQIKVLENHLSQALFYKQGRNVYLTQEGELLKGYTEQAFMALNMGVNELAQLKRQHLEVSCEPTLTMRWLMPRLSDFHQHSGVDVRLSTAGGPVTLGTSGLSLAIRRDDFELVHDYNKTTLVEEWVGPVCSPAYWHQAQHDVSKIKLLHSQTRPMAWDSWSSLYGDASLLGNTHQTFAHFYFCIQAAVDGLGAAMGSYPLVVDDLKRGNLIAPFGFVPSKHNYILLSQKSAPDALEQTFTQWLQQNLSQCVPSEDERAKGL
ncbi:LysR substrate-binding domain-containing protein [Enterovibrio norvegicus]|uniref:LysR family transcriptional regulator n=1 Tax=Enterovibrio norvegicus TaxID=188144 RepID=A0A2N7L9U9_9GAMM|nr:LysR substrate-binding domain-containing protein [Enterovibrio norvegicus]PMN73697.1 LysR family transcriptional regulator [Enterovibrio norvegicus]PMN91328.1 LysR family transcriptional regulator [Enterovibrio norvegicus]